MAQVNGNNIAAVRSDLLSGTPRSAYFHVPFCRQRCGYCNFAIVANRDYLIDEYLGAIEIELKSVPQGSELDTIYVGGGTPSHLAPRQLNKLLTIIRETFWVADGGEMTIEANPLDMTKETTAVLRDSPINRVSLGAQSFDSEKLKSLERDHRPDQVHTAIEAARRVTPNVSIDLIFAAPHDSLKIWKADLQAAIDLGTRHLSTYELTIEKGTSFWNRHRRGQLVKTDEDRCAEMYSLAIEMLTEAGLAHYEVSSFAVAGNRSRHNQVYWTGRPYWGFGPGAASLIGGVRKINHRSVKSYLHRMFGGDSPVQECESLSGQQLALDRFMFGLRLIDGINLTEFKRQTGFNPSEIVSPDVLLQLLNQGLMRRASDRLQLTRQGVLVCDWICEQLIANSNAYPD